MKSIKIKEQSFTMEDFEEGLMLAGLVAPSSISDLEKREALEVYENSLDKDKCNIYFKRTTLAAEIANNLCNEPTLGRVKFQKLIYLCEHAAEMNLNDKYEKFAAGPFDSKFMHSIEREFKKQKWFEVQKVKDGNFSRSFYKPLEKVDSYKKYYDSYFGDCKNKIQYIIDLFRSLKTDQTEIVATLYACAIELNHNHKRISIENLTNSFYSWSTEKKKYKEEQVIQSWKWMKEKGVVPEPH